MILGSEEIRDLPTCNIFQFSSFWNFHFAVIAILQQEKLLIGFYLININLMYLLIICSKINIELLDLKKNSQIIPCRVFWLRFGDSV